MRLSTDTRVNKGKIKEKRKKRNYGMSKGDTYTVGQWKKNETLGYEVIEDSSQDRRILIEKIHYVRQNIFHVQNKKTESYSDGYFKKKRNHQTY